MIWYCFWGRCPFQEQQRFVCAEFCGWDCLYEQMHLNAKLIFSNWLLLVNMHVIWIGFETSSALMITGRAHYFLCYSKVFFLLFTKIVVMIFSSISVGVSGCYKGRGSMCLPDGNFVCNWMSIYVDRRIQTVTLENDIGVSFWLVHTNIDHFLHVYNLWSRWMTIFLHIFISAGCRTSYSCFFIQACN